MNFKIYLKQNKKKIDKEMIRLIPKKINYEWAKNIFNSSKNETDLKALNEEISKPLWDFFNRGGKRWRPALAVIVCKILKGNEKKALKLSVIPELVHNGTIIVDDIEDNALIRRNKKALHLIYGIDTAINTGNLLYFIGLKLLDRIKLSKEEKIKLIQIYSQELINVSIGQALDINWHKKKYIPTEKEYFKMVALKTGALARLSAKIGAITSKASKKQFNAIERFAESIGISFQIQDDILNLMPASKKWGKEIGEDISEGKKSLLIIKALEELKGKEKKQLISIVNEKTKNKRKIMKAIKLIKKTNAINYAERKAEKIVLNAWKKLSKELPETKEKNLLKELAEFVVKRRM